MDLARELQSIEPRVTPSPVPGYEYVRGYGVYALPFDSGHVLALRVFPENDFAPYRSIWHRTPEGDWSLYADSPRLDIACPRYYRAAAQRSRHAHISLEWTGPVDLSIEMVPPRLQCTVSVATSPAMNLMNKISQGIPERLWRTPVLRWAFEHIGYVFFDLGDMTLSGNAPNGHFAILIPKIIHSTFVTTK